MKQWPPLNDSDFLEKLRFWVGKRRRFRVNGASMLPMLKEGEEVLVDVQAYEAALPQVGDIVVAQHPYKKIKLIKRVAEVLKDGRFVLKGDNLAESSDSRDFGAVSLEQIIGRVTSKF